MLTYYGHAMAAADVVLGIACIRGLITPEDDVQTVMRRYEPAFAAHLPGIVRDVLAMANSVQGGLPAAPAAGRAIWEEGNRVGWPASALYTCVMHVLDQIGGQAGRGESFGSTEQALRLELVRDVARVAGGQFLPSATLTESGQEPSVCVPPPGPHFVHRHRRHSCRPEVIRRGALLREFR